MQDFFKSVFASFVALILFVTLSFGGMLLFIVAIATASRDTGPQVEDKSMLVFDLSTEITDSQPANNPGEILGEVLAGNAPSNVIALRNVLAAIEAAAEDENIVGIYLDGNINAASGGSGLATLREVRQALLTFKESGKPIFAYETSWQERDFYLTSVADTLVLNPTGILEMNGFASEALFFANALEKFGIGVQPIRAGQYKSAVEPFVRNELSPQAEEQTEALLADLWAEFLTATSDSRDVTRSQLQTIADTQGILLADDALEAGLVDQVAYFDEIVDEIRQLTEEEAVEADDSEDAIVGTTFRQISLKSYGDIVAADTQEPESEPQIALVYAEGDIVDGEGGPGLVGGDRLARQIRNLRLDEDVEAIVLRINSSGGSAIASEIIAREVQLASEDKPVVVSMGSVAASGGYMIATYGDKIFASPNTITGSIGVFGLLPNIQEVANENGISWDVVKTGQLADLQTITRPKTAEELAISQRVVDQLYDRFLQLVSDSRPLARPQVAEIAQGRVWSGVAAQRLQLVDELGGLEAAIQEAAAQAELEEWRIQEYPRVPSFEERLINNFFSRWGDRLARSTPSRDPISVELQQLQADFASLTALNDPRGIYMRLPFNLHID